MKIKVHEIAKEFGIKVNLLLAELKSMDIAVKAISSNIPESDIAKIRADKKRIVAKLGEKIDTIKNNVDKYPVAGIIKNPKTNEFEVVGVMLTYSELSQLEHTVYHNTKSINGAIIEFGKMTVKHINPNLKV